jgi:hypothetical protein
MAKLKKGFEGSDLEVDVIYWNNSGPRDERAVVVHVGTQILGTTFTHRHALNQLIQMLIEARDEAFPIGKADLHA